MSKTKGKVCAFSIADEKNMVYFERMRRSLRKFHSEEELPLLLWDETKIRSYNDPQFFYRATPIIAKQLLKDYETVIKIDADSIITGDLKHILEATDYDVAAPLNWNRLDGMMGINVSVWDIPPQGYFNCGLVAMRSKEFVLKWHQLCFSPHFQAYQMREQDLMNILAYYFDWRFKNLDASNTWNGLISKGEFKRFQIVDGKLVCPYNVDGFPAKPQLVKVIHFAGGSVGYDKFSFYRQHCSEEVIDYLDNLIK